MIRALTGGMTEVECIIMELKYKMIICLMVCCLFFPKGMAERGIRAVKMDIESDSVLYAIYQEAIEGVDQYKEEIILASEELKESDAWMIEERLIMKDGERRLQLCEWKNGESDYYSEGTPVESVIYEKAFEGMKEKMPTGILEQLLIGNRRQLAMKRYDEVIDFQIGHVNEILVGVDYGVYYINCSCCDGKEAMEKIREHMSEEEWERLSTSPHEYFLEDLGDGLYLYMWRD